ncbi:MAG: nitroreductase, partial [Candidatus Marinimicrobia bacterium]|nr:nitroreductase [Candidatus Neomarinimicrobiota bacterium]
MKRREFVKIFTGGTMMLYAVALSGKTVEVNETGQEKRKNIDPDFISDDTREILRLASMAPSGHNTQPWMIHMIDPEHFMLRIDKSRYLPEVDPEHRETLLSMGCFLENLSLAAGNLGYRAEIDITAQTIHDTEIAVVHLHQDEQVTYPVEWMENRRTLRSGFKGEEIRTRDLNFLTEDDSDHWTYFSPGSSQSAYIEKVTLEAFTQQTYR